MPQSGWCGLVTHNYSESRPEGMPEVQHVSAHADDLARSLPADKAWNYSVRSTNILPTFFLATSTLPQQHPLLYELHETIYWLNLVSDSSIATSTGAAGAVGTDGKLPTRAVII